MAMLFGLVAAGFLLGVVLTSLIACQIFGCLHAEAVAVLDTGCLYRGPKGDAGGPEAGQTRTMT